MAEGGQSDALHPLRRHHGPGGGIGVPSVLLWARESRKRQAGGASVAPHPAKSLEAVRNSAQCRPRGKGAGQEWCAPTLVLHARSTSGMSTEDARDAPKKSGKRQRQFLPDIDY